MKIGLWSNPKKGGQKGNETSRGYDYLEIQTKKQLGPRAGGRKSSVKNWKASSVCKYLDHVHKSICMRQKEQKPNCNELKSERMGWWGQQV